MKLPLDAGQALTPIPIQPRRFYDGGLDAVGTAPEVPPDPAHDPRITLLRLTEDGLEQFAMERRIAYDDREIGQILVPRSTVTFRTDLTSVPALFTWLVPKTGAHLPAALIHDGLVCDPADPTYVADQVVPRFHADRVLRDAMADSGVGLVRRWLVWSAVTTLTMIQADREQNGWDTATRWRYRLAALLTLAVIIGCGVLATADLLGAPLGWARLPWMRTGSAVGDLAGGIAGAIVVPLLLALTWGRFARAGAVVGLALALLLHVTVALLVLSGVYRLAERAVRKAPLVVAGLSAVVVAVAVVVLLLALGS
jgi:hypothetical protein